MTPWYDTKEGLESRLDSLDGLREIYRARHDAWHDRQERMNEWVLLGRFVLDSCANLSRITEGAPAEILPLLTFLVPKVMTLQEAFTDVKRWACHNPFPIPVERCDSCGHAWNLSNVHECHWVSRQPTDISRHQKCHRLRLVQASYEDLGRLVERSEITVCSKRLIPNEYHPDDLYFGPWMLVETTRGRIRIGWRKRVINLDWKESTLRVPMEIFAEEDVTKWETGIHAWSEDKAVEYLRKVWVHGVD